MLGYTKEDLDAGSIRWDQMTAPGYEDINCQFREQLRSCGTTVPAEVEYFRKDGSRVGALVGLAALQAAPGEDRAIGFMFDLTEERKAREALSKSEEQFRQLTEHIREVFWMMDNKAQRVLYVSPAYEQIWGQTCESLYVNPEGWIDSIHPEDRPGAEQIFQRQITGEILTNEYRIVQPSGAIRWIRDRAFPIFDAAGEIVRLAGVAEDMTDRKLSELRLVHQALHDELTDLPNRRMFRNRLEQAVADCEPGKSGAVFFIDLDRFKLVNDTLGHAAGDSLLREVAGRLLAVCGEPGTLARFGGDEFTLVAAGFEERGAVEHLGRKLIACLDEPFRVADREVFIGASIGISMFPENGTDAYTLKRSANVAMHEAKRAGRNQLGFSPPGLPRPHSNSWRWNRGCAGRSRSLNSNSGFSRSSH